VIVRYVLLILLVLVAGCVAQGLRIQHEIDQRDENALFERYAGRNVTIVDSVEWPSHETCFEIEVSEPRPARASRQIVMISSVGHEKDNWGFNGEFRTMRECIAAFDRG
jgi:hypothetical protein